MKINVRQSSRIGKKQICCYIPKFNHLHIVNYARKCELSHQQALANIINAYCVDLNENPALPYYESYPLISRRKKGKAVIRKNASSKYRKTRIAISGWYPEKMVDELKDIAGRQDISLQKFCERAIVAKAKFLYEERRKLEEDHKNTKSVP